MKSGNSWGIATLFAILTFFTPMAAEATAEKVFEKDIILVLDPVIKIFSTNPWIRGGTVILVTFLLASLVTWLLFRLLRKLTSLTQLDLDDQVVLILRPPIYYSLLATGIYAGLDLMPLQEKTGVLVGRCIRTIGVFIWVYFFTRFASLLLKRLAGLRNKYSFIQNRTLTLFDNVAKILIFGVGLYAIFVIWKIDMTAWLASAGIAGIAIGFAAKDTLSNLFAGVFILADAPYRVGDYIVLDRGERGVVTHIGLRSTRILTRDDIEITVPNSIIGNSTIVNQSGGRHKKMRLRVKIGVAYGSDVDLVRRILMEIAEQESLVCGSPKPRVRFRVFGASSLDFELLCWIDDPELRGRVMDLINDAVYKAFEREKIEIPYMKQDLYIKGLPESMHGAVVQEET